MAPCRATEADLESKVVGKVFPGSPESSRSRMCTRRSKRSTRQLAEQIRTTVLEMSDGE